MELKKSISQKLRMDGRDYSLPGWYFITLGADYHQPLFGNVRDGKMMPNKLGALTERFWAEIPQHYNHIALGACQVMPNHFHGLLQITRAGGKGIGEVLNMFKGSVTREWRRSTGTLNTPNAPLVWAPNYYDVICFNANELHVRTRYIQANPKRWALRDLPEGSIRKSRYKGNVELLKTTHKKMLLRVSRKTSPIALDALKKKMEHFDGLICSTFFSPGERACLKILQTQSAAQLLWVLPMAMPKQIPVSWTDAFLENRALWISAFPTHQKEATRETCQQANHWAELFSKQLPTKSSRHGEIT